MTSPDLPMRERIAEAICEHDGWYGVPGEGAYCDCEHFLAPDGAYAVNAWKAHRADAVLTVLADLPDTAVEAGEAESEFHDGWRWASCENDSDTRVICSCRWVGERKDWERHRTREVLTATIAAIKEGKA